MYYDLFMSTYILILGNINNMEIKLLFKIIDSTHLNILDVLLNT